MKNQEIEGAVPVNGDKDYLFVPNRFGSPNPTLAEMLHAADPDHPARLLHGLGHVDDLLSDSTEIEVVAQDLPLDAPTAQLQLPGAARRADWPHPKAKALTAGPDGAVAITAYEGPDIDLKKRNGGMPMKGFNEAPE